MRNNMVIIVLVGLLTTLMYSNVAYSNDKTKARKAPALPMQVKLSGKPILVDFWASWCGPCVKSFPWLNEIKSKYPKLEIIAINLDEEKADAEAFLKQVPTTVEVYFDPEGIYAEKFEIPGMPSSFLIDAEGNIVKEHIGFFPSKKGEYEESIKFLLKSGLPSIADASKGP